GRAGARSAQAAPPRRCARTRAYRANLCRADAAAGRPAAVHGIAVPGLLRRGVPGRAGRRRLLADARRAAKPGAARAALARPGAARHRQRAGAGGVAAGDRRDLGPARGAARHAAGDHHRQPAVADRVGGADRTRAEALCRYPPGDPPSLFRGDIMTMTLSAGAAAMDMTAMREALAAGRVTAAALIDQAIARAEAVNPQ